MRQLFPALPLEDRRGVRRLASLTGVAPEELPSPDDAVPLAPRRPRLPCPRSFEDPDEPSGLQVLLQPRPLILTGLPYRRYDTLREVTRLARTGADSFLRVTYIATDRRYTLPYGADRSLLAWITTKAFQDGTVRFSAVADYFRAFGLDRGGRGYRLFWQRYQRVAALAIRIEQIDDGARHVRRLFLVPESVEPRELGADPAAAAGKRLFGYNRYHFRLDREFWQYLKATRVPTPLPLLRAFHDSPLRWDFAQWVLYRSYACRSPSVVPWPALLEQLGTADRDHRRLKWQLARTLETIRGLYPECGVRFLPGLRGLSVWPPTPCRLPRSLQGSHTPSEFTDVMQALGSNRRPFPLVVE